MWISEGVRRLKANCIEGFGRYAQEGHIGEDRNNRQGNLLRAQPQRAHKGLMKRSGCKGLTKGSKGSSPGTRAMAHIRFIWLIGIRDSVPPAPVPIIIDSPRS